MSGPEDIPGLEPHEVVTMRQVQTFLDIPCPSSIPSNKVVITCRYVFLRFLFKRFVTQKKTQVRNTTGKLVTNRGVHIQAFCIMEKQSDNLRVRKSIFGTNLKGDEGTLHGMKTVLNIIRTY